MSAEVPSIVAARERVFGAIADAAARAGRDPAGVTLVAVTKGVTADRVTEGVRVGLSTLGENRVQEGAEKIAAVDGATWHLIGPLQSNKARRAAELFDVVESVDAVDIAERLARLAREIRPERPLPVLLQVNVDADPAKAGFTPAGLDAALDSILDLEGLRVDGLMTVGRLVEHPEDARPTFVALRGLAARLRARDPRLGPALSMGMSDDYPIAVQEGATIVRVGRALFGARPAVR